MKKSLSSLKILRKKKSPSKRRESAMRSFWIESVCVLLDVSGVRSRFFYLFPSSVVWKKGGIFFWRQSSIKTFLLESGRFFTREEKIFPVEATLLVSTLTLWCGKFSTNNNTSSLSLSLWVCACARTALLFLLLLSSSLSDAPPRARGARAEVYKKGGLGKCTRGFGFRVGNFFLFCLSLFRVYRFFCFEHPFFASKKLQKRKARAHTQTHNT